MPLWEPLVVWDGQWEIPLLGIEAFGTRCPDLSTNPVHLLQLWAGAGLPLFWKAPGSGLLCLMAVGCSKSNPAFLVTGQTSQGAWLMGKGGSWERAGLGSRQEVSGSCLYWPS